MRAITTQRRRGVGMTEYIILVGLIGLGLVTGVKAFSWALEDSFFGASVNVLEVAENIGQ